MEVEMLNKVQSRFPSGKKINIFLILFFIVFISQIIYSQGWFQLTSGTLRTLNSIHFPDSNTGYAVGENGTIVKTTNSGLSWNLLQIDTNYYLSSVFFIDANTGYTVSLNIILKTTNGGLNWNAQFLNMGYHLYSVWFTGINNGYVSYGFSIRTGGILRTTDGGGSWNNSGLWIEPLHAVCFADTNNGYTVGGGYQFGGVVGKTTNGGTNWTFQLEGPYGFLRAVNFLNQTGTGIAIASQGSPDIIRTSDGGVNWVYQSLSTPALSVYLTSIDTAYTVGVTGSIFKTINAGTNWVNQISETKNDLYSVFFTSALIGYAAGSSGVILKTMTGGVAYIHPIGNIVPNRYNLYQNYPNPFNPSTVISFQLVVSSYTKLTIYDMLGNEVSTLVNEQLKPGTYEVEWDGSNYSSGVYNYKLQTEEYTETKRMVLLK
jgi:photosystem II stability/assembly factor-like uncharacterized protein